MEQIKMTVSEYAEKTGKSKQSVYKRIRKGTLKTVEEIVNGKKIAFVVVGAETAKVKDNPADNPDLTQLQDENNPDLTQLQDENNHADNREDNPKSNPADNAQGAIDDILEILKGQLAEKDKQIERLQTQIEANNKIIQDLQTLFDQQQKLHAASLKLLPTQNEEPQEQEPTEEQQAPNEEKHGFFYRLFHQLED